MRKKKEEDLNPFVTQKEFRLTAIQVSKNYVQTNENNVKDGIKTSIDSKGTNMVIMDSPVGTRLFRTQDAGDIVYGKLTNHGRLILNYIVYHLGFNADCIRLKQDTLCSKLNVSRPIISSGIQELISNFFIMKKSQSEYWINPFYMWNGTRYKCYDESLIDLIHQKSPKAKTN